MRKHNNMDLVTPGGKPAANKSKSQKADDSIMGTNNSSIVSKRSVERLYNPTEQFFRHFVKKFQRRSPLINRGYWLRMRAIDQVVKQFLEQKSDKSKVVINLGCGYDPLPWQCLTRYQSHCSGTKFIDIDYRDLMLKKRSVVQNTEELKVLLSNVEVSEGDVLLSSDQYLQIGCDLRDLGSLSRILSGVVDLGNSLILFTAEVSITYMNVEAADALIAWASKLSQARFCLLEQLLPDGNGHPFSQMMMSHFKKLGTPLGAIENYPTTSAQQLRFQSRGWPVVSARNLWKLWSLPEFVSTADREYLDTVEPFDEWEEFALFGCHYVLVVADTDNYSVMNSNPDKISLVNMTLESKSLTNSNMFFTENPKGQGCRRFAAAIPVTGQKRAADDIGIFGGMGLMARLNSYDVYSSTSDDQVQVQSAAMPSSRMCHTITDLGETGAILIGGRTSPDNALSDGWLYHKWLGTWERVDDLPWPLYRHQAVNLGGGVVLISTGRTSSRAISPDYLVWSRRTGWLKCAYAEGNTPPPTYGATFGGLNAMQSLGSNFGILAGGMKEDSSMQQASWRWDVKFLGSPDSSPLISFRQLQDFEAHSSIARFGASVVSYQGKTYVLGGIINDDILGSSSEIRRIDLQDNTLTCSEVSLTRHAECPRPLLVGITAVSTENALLVLGGSAVCFSFGTFLNKGCFTLLLESLPSDSNQSTCPWKYLRTIESEPLQKRQNVDPVEGSCGQADIKYLPRLRISSSEDFEKLVQASSPVILEGLDIGSCTTKWTAEYLKNQIGSERQIIVHQATTEHMNFTTKNFAYVPKGFGEFMNNIEAGEKLYLRSLSSEKPAEKAADIKEDFPTIAEDFRLPPELHLVLSNAHSSPLRISGPVNMWLHYDVMANVLCQVKGTKRLLLFPPSDFKYFGFEAGASSSNVNVFEKLLDGGMPGTHPHEARMQSGDILFLPPLWLHTASPTSGWSISVNIFFRNLKAGYAAGKDVYGNRDLQAYEKGRQDVAKIVGSFDKLPAGIRQFYLERLLEEFKQKIG